MSISDPSTYSEKTKATIYFIPLFRLGAIILIIQNLLLPPGILILIPSIENLSTILNGLIPLTLDIIGYGLLFFAIQEWKPILPQDKTFSEYRSISLMQRGALIFVIVSLLWRIPYFFVFPTSQVANCLVPPLFDQPDYCQPFVFYGIFIFFMVFVSNFFGLFVFWIGVLKALKGSIITKLFIIVYVLLNGVLLVLVLIDVLNEGHPHSLAIKTLTSVFIIVPLIHLAITGPIGFKAMDYATQSVFSSEFSL